MNESAHIAIRFAWRRCQHDPIGNCPICGGHLWDDIEHECPPAFVPVDDTRRYDYE